MMVKKKKLRKNWEVDEKEHGKNKKNISKIERIRQRKIVQHRQDKELQWINKNKNNVIRKSITIKIYS